MDLEHHFFLNELDTSNESFLDRLQDEIPDDLGYVPMIIDFTDED